MRRQHVIDGILKQDKVEHPTPNALWCKRCQRGMTGVEGVELLKEGNDCPLCVMLALDGEIAQDAVGVLKTCQTISDEWLEQIKMNHRQRELRMVRSIKDTGDVALEKTKEQDKVIEELRKQIAALSKVDAKAVDVPAGKMTVGKIDTKVGSK